MGFELAPQSQIKTIKSGAEMRKTMKIKKFTAYTMSAILLATSLTACSSAKENENKTISANPVSTDASAINGFGEGFGSKDETVYVTTGPDGSIKNILVSEWLKNSEGYASLKDLTSLSNIVNVKGDELFNINGDTISFAANGKDIYYQGQLPSDTKLPVSLNITYFIDEKEIPANEISGKSGRLTIRIDYTANEKATVKSNNETREIPIPFLAVTGLLMPTDIFTNIEVKGGQVISNGDYNMVFGMGFPGIREGIAPNISDAEIDFPDYVEITADVKGYSLDVMMTVCTNKIFSNISLEDFYNIDSISDMVALLGKSSVKLSDGASALKEGLELLSANTASLTSGIEKLTAGSTTLNDGLKTLNSGAIAVNSGIGKLTTALTEMIIAMNTTIKENNSQIDLLRNNITTYQGEITKLESQINQVNSAISAGLISSSDGNAQLVQLNGGISQYQSAIVQSTAGINQLTGANTALQTILEQMNAKDSNGKTLSDNLSSLSLGTQGLADGSTLLSAGAKELTDGLFQLKSKIPELTDGINRLVAGATELDTGMTQFNESAI